MRRLNGYSEKWLEDRLSAGLTSRGLLNFHMSDPTKPGIPDRYVVGGVWIEVKQGKTPAEIVKGFDRQRTFLDKLKRAGDTTLICALHQPNNYTAPHLYLESWGRWLWREKSIPNFTHRGMGGSPFEIRELRDLECAWDHLPGIISCG